MNDTFNAALAEIVRRAATKAEEGDYQVDGLLYCGKCNTPKQCRPEMLGGLVVGCRCACQRARDELVEQQAKADSTRLRAKRLRASGISDPSLTGCRFEKSDPSDGLDKLCRYAENWEEMRKRNIGLLLWGNTGTGKTHAAACVANELIDRGVSVVITSVNRLMSLDYDGKRDTMEQARTAQLLVLDDLGAERGTEYAKETVYNIVNERYKSGKPLIVTTNLTPDEFKSPGQLADGRVYDRVMELCVPVHFAGASRRSDGVAEKTKFARSLLGG